MSLTQMSPLSCRHARAWQSMPIVWETWLVSCIKARLYLANEEEHTVPELEIGNKEDVPAVSRHVTNPA